MNPCSHVFYDDDYVPCAFKVPYVTCQTYVIIDPKKHTILFSKNHDEIREMASLTKIMTTLVSINLAKDMKLNLKTHYFKVSKNAAKMIGTSANLTEN